MCNPNITDTRTLWEFFSDDDTNELFHIINIVYDTKHSLTLLYQYTRPGPQSSSFAARAEYTPCAEVLSAKWVHWIYEQPRNSTQTHHILPDILFANVAITYKNMLKEHRNCYAVVSYH